MSELPSGTVTFLFSDIEGSTRLLQQLGERWPELVTAHNSIMREAFANAGGREVDRQGDAFFAVFPRARNALAAAATSQRELAECEWPDDVDVRVRMGVHTGEPAVGDEGYLGLDVVRAARICALARGGQVLVSETTRALVRGELDGLSLQDVGEHRLKDIDEPERLFQLRGPGLRDNLPPPAPVAPSTDVVQAVAGREIELANQALARVRELELGPLESLGPAIERQVQEALAQTPAGDRDRVAKDLTSGLEQLQKLPVSPGWIIVFSVVFGLAIAAGVVALLIWLVSLVL
jgi:class 3 adenylate cyclase